MSNYSLKLLLPVSVFFLSFLVCGASGFCAETTVPDSVRLQGLLAKVYETMDENYYMPVSRDVYEDFLKEYPVGRLKALNKKSKKVDDYIQLGAGLLVNKLKNPLDRFTSLVPTEKSKAFKANAYAVTEDLGIEGKKTSAGFEITKVQKHCSAYLKGVRPQDLLISINGVSVLGLDEDQIKKELSPVLGSMTKLEIFFQSLKKKEVITLENKSYFKETVSTIPSEIPGVLVIKIAHFNQKTSDDFSEEIAAFGIPQIKHLVLDLRDNGGGPPLAAREILGFFLPQNDPLFAIARKKHRPVMLTTPVQPVAYHGPATVLVNSKTGSAAELFSGLMQAKKIGKLIGQKTAGATYLKSLYDLGDGSMIFMITSLTYFFNHTVYPQDGLTPDVVLNPDVDSLQFALDHLGQK